LARHLEPAVTAITKRTIVSGFVFSQCGARVTETPLPAAIPLFVIGLGQYLIWRFGSDISLLDLSVRIANCERERDAVVPTSST
jgi:hypothetical protein